MAIADITNSPDAQAFAASLAAKYGISPQAAQDAMLSLLPTLSAGIEHATLSPGGIARLLETMAQGHHQDIISNPDLVGHPDTVADGNSIIGQLMPRGLPQATLQAAASQIELAQKNVDELRPPESAKEESKCAQPPAARW